jgi:CheY-like chemotaxis protein
MPKTLLLADDSVTIQKVVGISLANEDIELVTVENGDDAVSRAGEIGPDIVLADIVMPGKNGYEVCETIKNDPKLRDTPVLLLTGTFEAFDAERARQVGADGHITKPFEAQALVDQVNQLLARAQRLGDVEMPVDEPAAAPQAAAAEAPPAAAAPGVGASGDAFDFFDGDDAESLGAGTRGRGQADETVLLDTTAQSQGSEDPAFDAAVEAAAFDAPGERRSFQEPDDSGFDLESADLSMASTVPEVGVAPGSMSFGEAAAPGETTEPPTPVAPQAPEPLAPAEPQPVAHDAPEPVAHDAPEPVAYDAPEPVAYDAPEPVAYDAPEPAETTQATDPLLDFDPMGEARSAAEDTVLDPAPVQSFDVVPSDESEPPAPEATSPAVEPTAVGSGREDTATVVEDLDPVRVQSPADATVSGPATPSAPPSAGRPEISPALEQQLHASLEKIAWEAFSDLSEQVVKQVLTRVEAIAWEVIPQMTELLVKEEIERMKGGGSEED